MKPLENHQLADEVRLLRDQIAKLRARQDSPDVNQVYRTADELFQKVLFTVNFRRKYEPTDHSTAP